MPGSRVRVPPLLLVRPALTPFISRPLVTIRSTLNHCVFELAESFSGTVQFRHKTSGQRWFGFVAHGAGNLSVTWNTVMIDPGVRSEAVESSRNNVLGPSATPASASY